jgi:hypothetical protein
LIPVLTVLKWLFILVTKEQGGRTNCRRLLFHSSCGTITGIFAWLYKDYGHACIPYGIKPAIIAIILSYFFLAKEIKNSSIRDYRYCFASCCLSSMKLYFFWRRILSFILESLTNKNSTTREQLDSADTFPVSKRLYWHLQI